jgi:hypothetical protein
MRYFFLLLLALPLCANAQFSNGFAPVGAVWLSNWVMQTGAGYKETRVISENIVGNTSYKTLNIQSVQTAGWGGNNLTSTQYLTIRNDSVWLATQPMQQTCFLYNFSANVGDEIDAPQSDLTRRAFSKVDSIKTINFLGQNKRATYYTKYCNTMPLGGYIVVEGLGIKDSYIYTPLVGYSCSIVEEYYENFVCYNDPTRSYPQNCLVATEEKTQNKSKIMVFPNPTSDILKINSTEVLEKLKISNLLGKIVLEKSENSTETMISVENLPQGVYFLSINDIFVQKILINR